MNKVSWLTLKNSQAFSLDTLSIIPIETFCEMIKKRAKKGERIAALFSYRQREGVRLCAVMANGLEGKFTFFAADVKRAYPSMTPELPAVHLFEREIAEQCGVIPEGHPWLKPVRAQNFFSSELQALENKTDFFAVAGEEIHEVAVGPVHAGTIEPGHFRFQCYGEEVLHLEIGLGYQHRGVESAIEGGPNKRTIHYMETLAGDTTIGHATAYCQVFESLSDIKISLRAESLRAICLELERVANHVGDLGALAGDIGFLPTASYCGRLRGAFLNMTATICGNRFGRGMIVPGGVGFDIDEVRIAQLLKQLDRSFKEAVDAICLLWNNPSVRARFEGVGVLTRSVCKKLGLVGPVARASGLKRDGRFEFPSGLYRFAQIPVSQWDSGDVFARAFVRWLEIQRSVDFIKMQLNMIPQGPIRVALKPTRASLLSIALVEGWRGEIVHIGMTDKEGKFSRYKIVDPSFHNWMGLALAMRDQQISDFPVCNKSFNLSYCGHDL